jgi:hypothetical protein
MGEIRSHAPTTQKQKYQHYAAKQINLRKEHTQHRAQTWHTNQATKDANKLLLTKQHNTTSPTAYITNLNTAQKELLRLHETYAHANMKEI